MAKASNLHEYSVSELSGALKATIEENFSLVRVRGELGRVSRPASGHIYLDLKDERAVLSGVVWKGMAARLKIEPEQGMEVVATGRLSTFPGQSRYQIIIDSLEPAGEGALMALFEKRKKLLAQEGLFAEERKRTLPFLPQTIGVVTSPSGAVIRDILHRLRERFPVHVLVWPTLVQGKEAERQIVNAIEGFNALPEGGAVPLPDVIIVARGGGSLEDLWCFNEESVARAAAASAIPLISAVGHETDTTLIDFVSDRRAPTPTAAAEIAVPVRSELLAELLNKERRLVDGQSRYFAELRARMTAAVRGLGRPEDIIGSEGQRFDRIADRLNSALRARTDQAAMALARASARFGPSVLRAGFDKRLSDLTRLMERARTGMIRTFERRADRLAGLRVTLLPTQTRLADAERSLEALSLRFARTAARAGEDQARDLERLSSLLGVLSHKNVLNRGYALVRDGQGELVRSVSSLVEGAKANLELADGRRDVEVIDPHKDRSPDTPKKKPKKLVPAASPGAQKSLFDG